MPQTVLFNEFALHVSRIAATASRRLLISSPYITERGTLSILDHIGPELRNSGELLVLTDCSAGNVVAGSLELEALLNLLAAVKRSRLVHIPNLHAKAYANDTGVGLVTSANLTTGGMLRNVELGVLVAGSAAETLVTVLDRLAWDGIDIARTQLHDLASIAAHLPKVRSPRPDRTIETAFSEVLRPTARGQPAERLRPVFARTILDVLKSGPRWAAELEGIVRARHPQLCDDTLHRAVAKKIVWRHEVHWALQELKHRGAIVHLAAKGEKGQWSLPSV